MKKLILLIIMTTVLTLTAACGGEAPPEQPGSTAATPGATAVSSGSGTPVAKPTPRPANTSIPAPTRPQRLQGLKKTPTPEPAAPSNPATATPVSPAATTVSSGSGTPVATQEGQPQDGEISIKDLVPQNPQLNDTVLLQDIYPHADLDQFALDPTQPVPLPIVREKGELVRIETPSELKQDFIHDDHPFPQWFLYENVRDHPYLHIFPRLQHAAHEEDPRRHQIEQIKDIAFRFDDSRPYPHTNREFPSEGITRFIYFPWFEPDTSPYHVHFGNNSTREVLAQAVTKAMEEAKYPTARPMPTLFGKEWIQEWRLGDFLRSPAYVTGDEPYDWFRSRHLDHVAPVTHWEFLHPQLPIIRVTSYNKVKLPLTVSSEDFSYKSLTDPNPNHSSQVFQIEKDAEDLRGRIGAMVPTTFAVSFVVSFQNRWTSFEDPDRLMVRFQDDFRNKVINNIGPTVQQRELHEEHSPNYWHPSDYMQHRLIGPVVLQVYESEVLQPGTYSAVPKVTHWEAPEFILPDSFYEALRAREGWRRADVRRWLQPGVPKFLDYPLPGHQAMRKHTEEQKDRFAEAYGGIRPDW